MFGSNNVIKHAAQGCTPSNLLPQRPAGMKQEGRASLIESSSAAQLQSLLAECLYLKGLPEESSHLARYSDGSQITAAGEVSVLCGVRKQAALGWIVMATGLALWV